VAQHTLNIHLNSHLELAQSQLVLDQELNQTENMRTSISPGPTVIGYGSAADTVPALIMYDVNKV
jgi:hypothetical protein